MRVMIFDTETSGFPEKGGRLIQFAAHVCDLSFDQPLVVQEFSTLIKLSGEMSEGAYNVHGISKEMTQTGINPEAVLRWFSNQVTSCDLIVAHNAAFDIKVMNSECRHTEQAEFKLPKVFCTMQASTDLCKLPGKYNNYKWPKLEEALPILCNEELVGAHDALADTRGCCTLFLELLRRALVPGFESVAFPKRKELL